MAGCRPERARHVPALHSLHRWHSAKLDITPSSRGMNTALAQCSMTMLLATRYCQRFKTVTMHSGIPPGTAHSWLSAVGAMQGVWANAAGAAPGSCRNVQRGQRQPMQVIAFKRRDITMATWVAYFCR